MANYDNSQYTYQQVLSGTGYFKKDDLLRYSVGVQELQTKLNYVGFWCGNPDGKFGNDTEIAVKHFQREYTGNANGTVAQSTLVQVDLKYASSSGFTLTSGNYGIYYNSQSNKFMYSQQVVFQALKNSGYNNKAIAGFMGNIEAESNFNPKWAGTGGSVGIVQWLGSRKTNLQNYVNGIYGDRENINEQTAFMLLELNSSSSYYIGSCGTLNTALSNSSIVTNAQDAADYVAALYEKCENYSSWSDVLQYADDPSRFTQNPPNAYNNRYYIDIAKRRGYADSYYSKIIGM